MPPNLSVQFITSVYIDSAAPDLFDVMGSVLSLLWSFNANCGNGQETHCNGHCDNRGVSGNA